ncbi:D-aminoacyl-tRNA deacylase [Hydrogenophaga atypica]|uniref:D-aminoacyl-tRNA deacylase n=1 Tax=Hydrogenophaga atypica TaxID=249409 RepID=A0ABW2QFH5_9BURK
MIAVLQRVSEARVVVDGVVVGEVGPGLLVLVCAEPADTEAVADKLLAKILKLRIFSDEAVAGPPQDGLAPLGGSEPRAAGSVGAKSTGKMNKSVVDVAGGLLIVSQFTLAADTTGGNRPSFTAAAPPALGERLYDHFVAQARAAHPVVQTGRFAADMKVHLVNDGPITIPLRMSAN